MENFNNIEKKFKSKGIVRGGILLVPINHALEMILEAEKEGVNILGIDGFFIKDDVTEPSMDNSVQFDEESSNHADAKKFLENKRSKGLLFEIVFDRYGVSGEASWDV